MNELFGGNVFDVGGGSSTKGMSVDSFMKTMGHDPLNAKEFEELEPEVKDLGGTESAREAYFNSISTMNSFGMEAAGKGVDILNPRTDQGRKAARIFQRLKGNANNQAAGLMTDAKVRKLYTEQRLKGGNSARPLGPGNAGYEDLDKLSRHKDITDRMEAKVKEINDHQAKEYDTAVQRDEAQLNIDAQIKELDEMAVALKKRGVPEVEADAFVNNAKTMVGKASYNALNNAKKVSEINKNNRANRGDKKDRKDLASKTKEWIAKSQNGNPEALNFFRGLKDASGEVIENVEFNTTTGGESILTLGTTKIVISEENGYGYGELYNLINSNQKASNKLSIEELDEVPDVNLSKVSDEAEAARVAKGNTISSTKLQSVIKESVGKEMSEETKKLFVGRTHNSKIIKSVDVSSNFLGTPKFNITYENGSDTTIKGIKEAIVREILSDLDVVDGTESSGLPDANVPPHLRK